ncbi:MULTISPECIES: DUF302 domain-containing protein [Acidianus]|uniref:DUF302 domain-containing protein n=1 Tax=Candidatus Acidianus copahuensis TaxID=1160895 RepID=A0A031LW92_9CREN|nr:MULTISPECIES: DUF302 domain-containing protein [Acidianus]EZQ12045.1 hypothetical protein CM19_00305 [Candidatus Acidianus copahuensis]NON63058.1 DUF302 domain-containing protein [Acidianus sp. RZ1]
MIIKECPKSFDSCQSELEQRIKNAGLFIFTIIDHSKAAEESSLHLDPTKVIVFGNPKVGTLLMLEKREIAYELPLRILIYSLQGKTYLAYKKPSDVGKEYGLSNDILRKMDELMEKLITF